MGDDVEAVHGRYTGALAVQQAQTTADRLLDQNSRIGSAQRHYGVKVRYVPALFEHVDVDDDLSRLVRVFDLEQPGDHFFFVSASLAGIDLDHLVLVSP